MKRYSMSSTWMGEEGMTLVELVVAMAILSIVMVVFTTVLGSVQRSAVLSDRYAQSNDQARLAVEQLDRELRSGNVIYDPAAESPAYYTLRVYTQSNLPTLGQAQCELWTIDPSQQLKVRTWLPGSNTWLTPSRTVASYVVNRTAGTHAFQLNPDAAKGGRTVDIHLLVNPDYANHPERTIEIEASLTGRNTSYSYPTSICQTLPTG